MTEDIPVTDAIPEDALSGAIGKLLEHPELISMVASAIGDAQQSESKPASVEMAADASAPTAKNDDVTSAVLPMLSKLSSLGSGGTRSGLGGFKHESLLCALKPYLSKNRCDAIDYILRISKLSSIIGQLR